MEKKEYQKPAIKVRAVNADSDILATSLPTPIDDDDATGGGDAKPSTFKLLEEDTEPTANDIWDE